MDSPNAGGAHAAAATAAAGSSGPARAPSGIPPLLSCESPTWWKSANGMCTVTVSHQSTTCTGRRREGRTEDLAVHHDLPGVDGEVRVVETPVELLGRLRLVRRVVVGRDVLVPERLGGRNAFARVKDEHLLEQIDG